MRRTVLFGTAELKQDRRSPSSWRLLVDGVLQSYVDLDDPTNLAMPYTDWIGQIVDRHWAEGEPITAVHVGGGGFTVPRYVATTRPGTTQTVFELDGALVELVREHLELDAVPGLRVEVRDGRAGVREFPDASVDLVFMDVFRGGAVATELATVEAVTEISRVLRGRGLYLTNLWDGDDLGFARRAIAAIGTVFPHLLVMAEAGVVMRKRPGNFIVAGSTVELPVAGLTEWAVADRNSVHCLTLAQLAAVWGDAAPLTDADQLTRATPSVRRHRVAD